MTDRKKQGSIYSKMHNTENLLADVDNEQLYKKIVDLLLAAGYYRARIQNLEPFDKVLFKTKLFLKLNININ